MSFKSLYETTLHESRKKESKDILKEALDYFVEYINDVQGNNPDIKTKEILSSIKDDIREYLESQSITNVRIRTIETYLNKRIFSSSKYNLNTAYNDVVKAVENDEIDLKKYKNSSLEYTYNNEENTRILVCAMLSKIREEKSKVRKYINNSEDLIKCRTASKKEINSIIKKASNGDSEQEKRLKKIISFDGKSEKEILIEEYKQYTKESAEKLKEETINSITRNIEFIDKYSFLQNSVNFYNQTFKSIYMNGYEFSYDEIKQMLSESELKKLNTEQLIAVNAFWINRVSKVINQIQKGIYILSHPELYESKKDKDGRVEIKISEENLSGVDIKMNLLQKISFDIFKEHEGSQSDLDEAIKETDRNYGKDYRDSLDKLLIYSKNDLEKDFEEGLLFQNIAYNLYKIKSENMQALLMGLLNDESRSISNYGYIDDFTGKNIKERKYILLGFDVNGMNMPLRLHTPKEMILDVLNGVQKGNTKLREYKGDNDFKFGDGKVISTIIYLPLSDEKKKILSDNEKRSNPKDKYMKTIQHLNYIGGNGRMPKYLATGIKEVDLCGKDRDIEK